MNIFASSAKHHHQQSLPREIYSHHPFVSSSFPSFLLSYIHSNSGGNGGGGGMRLNNRGVRQKSNMFLMHPPKPVISANQPASLATQPPPPTDGHPFSCNGRTDGRMDGAI
jgi:hypothetical protein